MRFFTRLINGFALGIFTICGGGAASAQGDYPPVAVMSYNVENLFSPWVDSVNPDESFTPNGEKHWTIKRVNTKAQRIADGIASASAGRPPAIVGLRGGGSDCAALVNGQDLSQADQLLDLPPRLARP